MNTPWGKSDGERVIGEGITSYSTPSHGGIKVRCKQRRTMPLPYQNQSGWYEEDCEWAKVALSFPHLFTPEEVESARRTAKHYFPDAYEQATGEEIPAGESRAKDGRRFRAEHPDAWVVVAATGDWHPDVPEGMVQVLACQNGGRTETGQYGGRRRAFLVPKEEYDTRTERTAEWPLGFVVDPLRHKEVAGV